MKEKCHSVQKEGVIKVSFTRKNNFIVKSMYNLLKQRVTMRPWVLHVEWEYIWIRFNRKMMNKLDILSLVEFISRIVDEPNKAADDNMHCGPVAHFS